MAKLSINHLFATALFLIRSQRRKREREKKKEFLDSTFIYL